MAGPDTVSADVFGSPVPMGTGAPGSTPAPCGSPSAQSPSSLTGEKLGAIQPSVHQIPQGTELQDPQYARPGFTAADGYASTGAHQGFTGQVGNPDAAQADLARDAMTGQFK